MESVVATCLRLIQQGEWQQASLLVDELPPDDQYEVRAYLATQMGDVVAAESALRAALAHKAKSNTYALLASNLYQQGRYAEARALWQPLEADTPRVSFHMAQSYLAEDNYRAALPCLERCLQHYPEDVALLFQLATVLCQLEQPAQSYFEAVLRLDPYHLEALNNYGVYCLKSKDYDTAIHCFATAMRLDAAHLPSRANLAQTLLQAGRYQEAQDYFDQYLALAPDDWNAVYNAGVVALLLAQHDRAADYFLKVVAQSPDNIPSLLNLAAIAIHRQEPSNAVGYYQRVLTLDPQQPIATYTLAALTSQDTINKAPDEYISALFDQYADHFDQHLCQALAYQTPQHLRDLYNRVALPLPRAARCLDLGCGTGLTAAAFADTGVSFIGVDLSLQMLAVARAKNLYVECVRAEMVAYLNQSNECFAAIFAADVLGYVGDLSEWFSACAAHLAVGACLWLSIEVSSATAPFSLMPNGRFQHRLDYVQRLATANGLHVAGEQKVILRQQAGLPVQGYVIGLRNQELGSRSQEC